MGQDDASMRSTLRCGLCAQDYLEREVDSTLSGGELKESSLLQYWQDSSKLQYLMSQRQVLTFGASKAGRDL